MKNTQNFLGKIDERSREEELLEKIEVLERVLEKALHYCSVMKYNNIFHMGWDVSEFREIDKKLYAYCLARAVKIRKCETDDERFGLVNSYPLMIWDDFLHCGE
jgi:hypothetical protein